MWSNSKVVNTVLNILLFLVGINFLHYGQLILPIMCLIIFVDNKYKLKIANYKIFIILILFSISFFLFSYKLGFYSVMGFCLPMAYYIGSNISNEKENIKKGLYVVSFGMACHMIINFIMELTFWYDDLSYMFNKPTHYDFWLQGPINTTAMALNSIFIIAIIYYIVIYEKNKFYKYTGLVIFVLTTIYNFAIGRRTTFFIYIIAFGLSLLLDMTMNKDIRKNINALKYILPILIIVILIIVLNVLDIRDIIFSTSIFKRLIEKGLYSGRIEILIKSIKLAPKYLWGGQNITQQLGAVIHNVWGDIYDYAGILPTLFFSIYLYQSLKECIKYSMKTKDSFKIAMIVWLICVALILLLEPVMTGASIFMICVVIVNSMIRC